jgi:thiol-disulfide isomerase/thioredoxin
MSVEVPRPALLALGLLLIVGAIAFFEFRLGAASPDDASSQEASKPRPSAQKSTVANGSRLETREGSAKDRSTASESAQSDEARVLRKEAEFERAKEIVDPTGFINTNRLSIGEFAGEKVILLDFWAYSCYNCQNTQPYLNAWYDKYWNDGLVIIGVHTPEFEFEKDYANVEVAVRQADIKYPIVLDNNGATWNAYDQRYWPTMYLIDADGFIRYKHIGEGAYEETEAKIRELLAERDEAAN